MGGMFPKVSQWQWYEIAPAWEVHTHELGKDALIKHGNAISYSFLSS